MADRLTVDASRCIRCAACSTLVPALFSLRDGIVTVAIVIRQPRDAEEQVLAQAALVNCPASAIGVRHE